VLPLVSTGNECGEPVDLRLLLTLQKSSPGPRTKITTARFSRCDESNTITVMKSFIVVRILPGLIVLDERRLTWTAKAVVAVYHLASHNEAFKWRGVRIVHDDITHTRRGVMTH
jgi:hypothetical protein